MGKADNNTIKQIQFLRKIYRLDWHGGSTEYENADDQLLFLVHTANGNKYCVNNTQLREFIGDEDWMNGEVNTLSNIASNLKPYHLTLLGFQEKGHQEFGMQSFTV